MNDKFFRFSIWYDWYSQSEVFCSVANKCGLYDSWHLHGGHFLQLKAFCRFSVALKACGMFASKKHHFPIQYNSFAYSHNWEDSFMFYQNVYSLSKKHLMNEFLEIIKQHFILLPHIYFIRDELENLWQKNCRSIYLQGFDLNLQSKQIENIAWLFRMSIKPINANKLPFTIWIPCHANAEANEFPSVTHHWASYFTTLHRQNWKCDAV